MSTTALRSFGIWCWWQDQARPVSESSGVSSFFLVCSRDCSWCVSCLDTSQCSPNGFPRSWTALGFHNLLYVSHKCHKNTLSLDRCQVVVEGGISEGRDILAILLTSLLHWSFLYSIQLVVYLVDSEQKKILSQLTFLSLLPCTKLIWPSFRQ